MKKITILLSVLSLVALVLLSCRTDIKTVCYTIPSKKITSNVRIALITDFHSCQYGTGQKKLLHKLSKANPDVILLGGDIVDDKLPIEHAKEFLSAISERYPCFYVSGNHEYRSQQIDALKEMIRGYGITVLEGETVKFETNGQIITIAGVDDPDGGVEQFETQLKTCHEGIDPSIFSILLSHRPEYIDLYRTYCFDLIACGHAHGGQWRIPGVLNGLWAPNQGLFPKYAGGLYDFYDTQLIVSRGLAKESTLVPRICNRPEVVIVNLVPHK